jgi:hypothetical protein
MNPREGSKSMWTGQCSNTTKRGKQCKRRSIFAVWAFGFEGEKFGTPTWVEQCGHHLYDGVHGAVEVMRISHYTKGSKS